TIKNSKLTVLQSGRTFLSKALPDGLNKYVCLVDEERMDQLFSNLISNAIKNTDEIDGIIETEITMNDEYVTISLIDNGRGIIQEDLPHIFERFYKQKTRSDEPTGTGLGLAIVKQIIDNHRGKISVESDVGEGTTFHISLPIKHVDESSNIHHIDNYESTNN